MISPAEEIAARDNARCHSRLASGAQIWAPVAAAGARPGAGGRRGADGRAEGDGDGCRAGIVASIELTPLSATFQAERITNPMTMSR